MLLEWEIILLVPYRLSFEYQEFITDPDQEYISGIRFL